MKDKFPDTPNTIIDILMNPDSPKYKEFVKRTKWGDFLKIYHNVIRKMVQNTFASHNWVNLDDDILKTVVSDVILALAKSFDEKKYDKKISKFRYYLKRFCHNKSIDFMRSHYRKDRLNTPIDDFENTLQDPYNFVEELSAEEERAYKLAQINECYDTVKMRFSREVLLSFDGIYRENKKAGIVSVELGLATKKVSDNANRFKTALIEELQKKGLK